MAKFTTVYIKDTGNWFIAQGEFKPYRLQTEGLLRGDEEKWTIIQDDRVNGQHGSIPFERTEGIRSVCRS